MLSTALTLWRKDGYSDVSQGNEQDGTLQVTANDGAYTLAVYVGTDGSTGVFVSSCYSTPGPATETTNYSTFSPMVGGSPIASSAATGATTTP